MAVDLTPETDVKLKSRILDELAILLREYTLDEHIDIHEDLLDLGFNSITLLDLLRRVNERFGLDVEPMAVLDYPSLDELADHLTDVGGERLARELSITVEDS